MCGLSLYKSNPRQRVVFHCIDTVTRKKQAISNNANPKLDDIKELITDVSTLITESAETYNMLNKRVLRKMSGCVNVTMTISHGTLTNVMSSEKSILNLKTDIEI